MVDVNKQVTTIKSAYGGFQAGENRTVELVVKTIFKFAGYTYGPLLGLFFVGLFTKWKKLWIWIMD